MKNVVIPEWNILGLLSPIDSTQPLSVERSPYSVALLDVVMRFSTSVERRRVLHGFLEYRAVLHVMGLTEGFQWLDGSFMEEVEMLEHRAPNDIDVVTFVQIPIDFSPTDEQVALIEHDIAKTKFLVDSYIVEMNTLESRNLVERSAYWYSVWSHRRNQVWKGYLQVDLHPKQDQEARDWLNKLNATKEA